MVIACSRLIRTISKGIPPEKDHADDRIPTEINKLLEHPDRRIRPIVYTRLIQAHGLDHVTN